MKCPKCKKDCKAAVEAAYDLGVLDGEKRNRIALNNVQKANGILFRELKHKDKVCPRNDCRVWLSRDYAERLVISFKFLGGCFRAKQLQGIIRKQIKTFIDINNSKV